MLTSYGLCWNPSLGTWDLKWRVGVECQRRNCLLSEFSDGLAKQARPGVNPYIETAFGV